MSLFCLGALGGCRDQGGTGILPVLTAETAVSRLCAIPIKRAPFRDSVGQNGLGALNTDFTDCTEARGDVG
jgi:hypothetical protein